MSHESAHFDTDIAVVGMAGRFAGARNLVEYWDNLRGGVESIRRLSDEELLAAGVTAEDLANPAYVRASAPLPDMQAFDGAFFGFTPREASIMDPQHRHFLECCWLALEDAAHLPENFDGAIGVYAGSGHNAYLPYNLLSNPQLVQSVGFFLLRHTGNDKDFMTTRASYLLNLKGPSVNVQTACSTSLVAIHTGCQALLNGECDMVLAGGVTIELPHGRGYVYEEGEILSPDGHCRAFDAESKGTVFGSGVGVVVLRRLADAIADGDHIHAVIKGSAINNDGSGKVGYLAPSVDGQAQSIAEALSIANVPAESISYIETHGTGTPVGDPIEVAALTQVFRQETERKGFCGIGSVKSNIGHTDTAAGVASFIKVALALQHQELPPTLHFRRPNPACELESSPFYVNAALKPWQTPAGAPRRAGVSSLGVGGTNAHVVLEEAPQREPSAPQRREYQLFSLSAKTASALDRGSLALRAHLQRHPALNLGDLAYTLRVGRRPMKHRRIVVARDAADAARVLDGADALRAATLEGHEGPRTLAFMFAGGGAQHPGMGADLYRAEPVFKQAVDECLALMRTREGVDLAPLLFPPPGTEADAAAQLERPSLALPALFTVQRAQALLWQSWGVLPTACIGHSMGEYTAAHLAGVFGLADALALVSLRGRLFETLPEGAMLSVPLSADELAPLLGPDLSIAAANGAQLSVASGPVQAIEHLAAELAAREIDATRVRIKVAAHSSMLEPILAEFAAFLKRVPMGAPTLPFVSNVSGTWISAAEATDPSYWVRHLRQTVRFADGLQQLLADERCLLLEVGPGRTLSSLARLHLARKPVQSVVNGMRHADEKVSDLACMLLTLGRLAASGLEVDWQRLEGEAPRQRLSLPGYGFDPQRHWIEPGHAAPTTNATSEGPLARQADVGRWFYQPVWRQTPGLAAPLSVAGEVVLLLADQGGLAERLAARCRAAGAVAVLVRDGPAFALDRDGSYTVDLGRTDDHQRLLSALVSSGRAPRRIVYGAGLFGERRLAGLDALRFQERNGLFGLLRLAQALGAEDLSGPLDLTVLTDRAQRVAGDTQLEPAAALVIGACKVLPQELPNLACRTVDVVWPPAGARQEAALVDALWLELLGAGEGDVVAYRAGTRWVQEFGAATLPVPAPASTALDERSVVLITGGLGGVGLALAEHLARECRARLVLVGRSALPARPRWDEILRDPATPQLLAARLRAVRRMEAAGAEVLVLAADVADAAAMRRVIAQTQERFGALHGVLHAAGVLDDGPVQLKDEDAVRAVLAPKVEGTLALEAAWRHAGPALQPRFVVLFSSISAYAGLAGQFDYAAANAFLDAFAQRSALGDGPYTVAIDWSQWQDVGMAAALARVQGLGDAGLDGEDDASAIAHPLVQHRLAPRREGESVYATRFAIDTHWLLDEHRVRGGEALIPGTGYLELLRAAVAAQSRGGSVFELRELTFLAPFVVHAHEARDLRVRLRDRSEGGWDVEVLGAPADGGSARAWLEHVRGQACVLDLPPPPALPLAALRERCRRSSRSLRGDEQPVHLAFGPRWGNLRRVDFGDGEALVTLQLPQAFETDLSTFALHPSLMDWATAGAQALIPGYDEGREFYVPASYGRLRQFAPLVPGLFSHVRLRADETLAGDVAVFDVSLADESGRVLVEIERFTMLRLRDKALFADAAAVPAAHHAKPRVVANAQLAAGLREGIATAEGVQALMRVLAQSSLAQVAVSPQHLSSMLAALRRPVAPPSAATAGADTLSGDTGRAPRTDTEKTIAALWAELLGVSNVGLDANFFDLGGHSLLAVQVINKLKKKTGRPLALTALMEAPTVESLALLIDPEGSAAAGALEPICPAIAPTPMPAIAAPVVAAIAAVAAPREPGQANRALVTIRKGTGARQPLYFVHDGLGETLLYRSLAHQLDGGPTVYGLQPAQRADGSYIHTRIVDMAAAHLRQVRAQQPHGPYFLAGLCAGGVIAMEMAWQLQQAGETVAFVGIMDAADVKAAEIPWRGAKLRWQRILGAVDRAGGLAHATPLLLGKAFNYLAYQLRSRLDRRRHAREVERLRERGLADAQGNGEQLIAFLPMYEVAHRQHEPQGRLTDVQVALYRALQGDGSAPDEAYVDIYSDPLLGWQARVDGPIACVDVPGGHTSLLQEPHVKVLAAAMQRHLDMAWSPAPGASSVRTAAPVPATPLISAA
jgi:acyl transferase domain-containing protein/thioesterase domain-containing protein